MELNVLFVYFLAKLGKGSRGKTKETKE